MAAAVYCSLSRSLHAAAPHSRSMKIAIVESALADAFRGTLSIRTGFLQKVPETASAKADPTGTFSEQYRERGPETGNAISASPQFFRN